jgi:tetratricopeptide (TPR) repeat protein
VRRAGDKVRVTAQLIDGRSGEHIWAEKLDGPMGDIFDFQDRVTDSVVGLIEPEIRKTEIGRAQRKHPESLDAHDLYWRALPLLQSADDNGYTEAVDFLDRAVELAPDYAPILSMAAYAHDKRKGRSTAPPGVDDFAIAVSLAERALAADSSDPFAILVSAMIEGSKGNRAAALAMARRAYELNPNHVLICNITGWLTWTGGHYEEALTCHARSLLVSPGVRETFWGMGGVARCHLSAGRPEEALLWALRALDVNPDFADACVYAISAFSLLGQIDGARGALADLTARKPDTTLDKLIAATSGDLAPHLRYQREGLERLQTALN